MTVGAVSNATADATELLLINYLIFVFLTNPVLPFQLTVETILTAVPALIIP